MHGVQDVYHKLKSLEKLVCKHNTFVYACIADQYTLV